MSEIYDTPGFAKLAYDILESIPYLVACDTNGIITYINEQYALECFNQKACELIGKPVKDVIVAGRLPQVIRNGKGEVSYHYTFTSIVAKNGGEKYGSLCERLPVHENGDPDAPIRGAVGFTIAEEGMDLDTFSRELSFLARKIDEYHGRFNDSAEAATILGSSESIDRLTNTIKKVSKSNASVCIIGETGTGKELVADELYKHSSRSKKSYIKVNCAAIPKELMESELFGYEPGSFTGASRSGKMGKFQLADGGTILLDEIGEMPYGLQAKLLRVLQEGQVEKIGGVKPIDVDVRVICSTNRDLKAMVDRGEFRADLYYRLNTFEIKVPPLRDHKEDIYELVAHFIRTVNARERLDVSGLSDEVYESFMTYDWPGNIRELEHAIERACIIAEYGILMPEHFDSRFYASSDESSNSGKLYALRSNIERANISAALKKFKGNKTKTAESLGLSRTVLYRKMKKYGLE